MVSVSKRLDKVFSASKKARVALLINTANTDPNFSYLTGFTGTFEGSLLIALPKKEILLVSPLEYGVAKKMKPKEMQIVLMESRKKIEATLKKYLKGKTVGINGSFMPFRLYKRLKKLSGAKRLVDISEAFYSARNIKDESEIAMIRGANSIIKRALRKIPKYFKDGVTEREIATKLNELAIEFGGDGPSFPTIVCFGANSAIPHYVPADARLEPNSFVLIDCGTKYGNYCSDVTRTFIYKPKKKSEKYRKMMDMYKTVKEAQLLALKSVKPGVKGSVPHNIAAEHIDKAFNGRYKGKFIHTLGHAIGIEVHDPGTGFFPSETDKLREGMVISDEPGIYVNGFGGVRIEDDVLVTKKGAKIL